MADDPAPVGVNVQLVRLPPPDPKWGDLGLSVGMIGSVVGSAPNDATLRSVTFSGSRGSVWLAPEHYRRVTPVTRWEPDPKAAAGDRIGASVANEYGAPYVTRRGEGYVIGIENAGEARSEEPVSRDFYEAWVKEFGGGARAE